MSNEASNKAEASAFFPAHGLLDIKCIQSYTYAIVEFKVDMLRLCQLTWLLNRKPSVP